MSSIKLAAAIVALFLVVAAQPSYTQTETVLFNFDDVHGRFPNGELVRDAQGNLYGTTSQGGTKNFGTVFEFAADGTEKSLYNFKTAPDAKYPNAGLVRDAEGNLYGTTNAGGKNRGAVFRVTPTGIETLLHRFTNSPDGRCPCSALIMDDNGNLYGTTERAGNPGIHAYGTVFEIAVDGTEKILYAFTGGADGGVPIGRLVRDAKGNLYGTTSAGGAFGLGTVFQLTLSGTEKVLHNFSGPPDGRAPYGDLIRDTKGNLYGTSGGGSGSCNGGNGGCGVIFKVTRAGAETVIYSFTDEVDGNGPNSLIQDKDGNIFGVTGFGGTSDQGTVFEVTPEGTKTVLYNFTGLNGTGPVGLVRDKQGHFYGTTKSGGTAGIGTIFALVP